MRNLSELPRKKEATLKIINNFMKDESSGPPTAKTGVHALNPRTPSSSSEGVKMPIPVKERETVSARGKVLVGVR